MAKLEEIKYLVEEGETKKIATNVQEALDEGIAAEDILQIMIDSMRVIGDKFSTGDIYIPEMLMAAKAMTNGLDVLKPLLAASDSTTSLGTCVIGTVEGDLHDIGKNLVSVMLESVGFDIVDLGVDVPTTRWIEAIKEHQNVTLVACSALLTTTFPGMKETVRAMKDSGLSGFKVIIGGASVNQKLADDIGADGYSEDAGSAAVKAVELVSSMQ
ncbi:MAG: cobalamin-binding protein [Firmicutes bacterium HGW-Firmicutes-11]|jgi:methanogenic corrinoid protein MtbC1|nr:MAG: cobalamin-binding protein [Firmicutes bacterium HGW-Firmicutes-11]